MRGSLSSAFLYLQKQPDPETIREQTFTLVLILLILRKRFSIACHPSTPAGPFLSIFQHSKSETFWRICYNLHSCTALLSNLIITWTFVLTHILHTAIKLYLLSSGKKHESLFSCYSLCPNLDECKYCFPFARAAFSWAHGWTPVFLPPHTYILLWELRSYFSKEPVKAKGGVHACTWRCSPDTAICMSKATGQGAFPEEDPLTHRSSRVGTGTADFQASSHYWETASNSLFCPPLQSSDLGSHAW